MSTTVKLVVAGDGGVGKTCLLIAFAHNTFPAEYVPTVFDQHSTEIILEDKPVILSLWDTSTQGEDYDRLRPLSYPKTDVFLLCYSVEKPDSFSNITARWIPEIRHYCPNTPILIVACKTDLYPDSADGELQDGEFVRRAEGMRMAEDCGASYAETSALTLTGLKECFDQAGQLGVMHSVNKAKSKSFFSFKFMTRNKPAQSSSVKPPGGKWKYCPFR